MEALSFQDIILTLQNYWSKQGCTLIQPYDVEVGAGTFHPATVLRALSDKSWNVAYVQPSRRPADSRYGEHPNRLQHYYQFQVIMKPSPKNMQELYLGSIKALGIDPELHDIRFVEDDWESPTLGASGLGWEVWCNGMEVSQFTYMQNIGGVECRSVAGELTYGLERIALYIQNISNFKEIIWNKSPNGEIVKYGNIYAESERQFSTYNLEYADTDKLFKHFADAEAQCQELIEQNLPYPAYDFCIKASHFFNLLDARGVLSVTERAAYISRIRNLAKACCGAWVKSSKSE